MELNAKDQSDILTMLYHHEVADNDEAHINAERVAELCAPTGLWRTTKMNVERTRAAVLASGLEPDGQQLVLDRLERSGGASRMSRSRAKWKLRNRVGDKKRWYLAPEETQ